MGTKGDNYFLARRFPVARISVLFYMVSSAVQLVCFCPDGKLYLVLPGLVLYFVLLMVLDQLCWWC